MMDRREAIQKIEAIIDNGQDYGYWTDAQRKALDLAIEALEREIEYGQAVVDFTKGETMKSDEWKYDITCDAESATTTDCISRADTIKAMCAECRCEDECGGECTEVAIIKGMPSMSEEEVDYCNNCPYISWGGDCISRQQMVEAIEGVDWYHVNSKGELVHGSTSDEESWYKAEDIYKAIESLPPVTPTEQQEHGRLIDADKLLQELFIVDEEEWTTPEIRAILENASSITPTERTREGKEV